MLYFLSVVNLLITGQAIFLCFHFAFKKQGEDGHNKLVASLSFIFALITLNTFANLNGNFFHVLQDVANNSMWFVGPCLYLFATSHGKTLESKKLSIHILPYLLPAAIGVFIHVPYVQNYIPLLGFSQIIIYLITSVVQSIKNYREAKRYFNWILPSIVSFAVLIFLNFSLTIFEHLGIQLLPNLVLQSFTSVLAVPIFFIAYKEMNSTGDFGLGKGKYKSSHLTDVQKREYLEKVEKALVQEKMFLDPNLTLSALSDHIGVQTKYISQAINQQLNMSFSDYLNQFRIEQVKKDLVDPSKDHMTINGIASGAGFASSSRFSHLFKKHVGKTPGQYKKEQSKK